MRAELLAIEGIASAELEGSDEAPLGVRVQLTAGADPHSVGIEVQRVLASHGMRSHHATGPGAGDDVDSEASRSTADSSISTEAVGQPDQQGPPPPPGAGVGGTAAVLPMRAVTSEETIREVTVESAPSTRESVELDSVAVEESRTGISVRVTVGGSTATRQVGASPDAMDAAIVGALAELAGIEAELVAAQRGEAAGATIVTVLLDVAGTGRQVGSAVVAAGDAYAVAQAAWRALRAPE